MHGKGSGRRSPSSSSSQPSVLTSSRATRAASCGWPLESRITISICRPARPPAALTFSTSSITALREDVPSCATRPDKIVGMPILMVLAWARATQGAATLIAPAPISASVERRLMPGVRVLVIFPSLFRVGVSWSRSLVSCRRSSRLRVPNNFRGRG